jgi:hypothetical protein
MAGWPSRDGARFMGTWLARSMPNESPAGGRGFRTSDSARMYTSKTGVRRLAELRGLNACVGRGFQAYADLRGETAPPAARSLAWFSPHSSSRASDVSRSTANRSHVFANSSKRSLAMADDEDVANSAQCLACSRHSLGSPGKNKGAKQADKGTSEIFHVSYSSLFSGVALNAPPTICFHRAPLLIGRGRTRCRCGAWRCLCTDSPRAFLRHTSRGLNSAPAFAID